jgi:exopolysaccharide production protein ExoQ
MDLPGNPGFVGDLDVLRSRAAKISFFIYFFFVFFGTSLPFQEKIGDAGDISTSNPVNQFVYSSLYIISLIAIIPKRDRVLRFIRSEKFLSLFLLWALLTVLWSDFPWTSFKRWIQILGMVVILLSALLYARTSNECIRSFRLILLLYIPLNLLAILLVPAAMQGDSPAWRGLAVHKNSLGQIMLVCLVIWTYALRHAEIGSRKTATLFFCLSLVLLVGSRSTTCMVTAVLLLFLAASPHVGKFLIRRTAGGPFTFILVFSFLLGVLLVFQLEVSLFGFLTSLLEKDPTLTGRTDLWASIFQETRKHLLFGSGFGGFWVPNSPAIERLYQEYVWLPNEAHLGYLDILNETGVVGLSLCVIMMISYFSKLSTAKNPHFWKWFVVLTLIVNFSESTLFRMNALTFVVFTFAYIALHVELIQDLDATQPEAPFTQRYEVPGTSRSRR